MSHPRLLWQVNKCLIQLVSTGGGDDDDKVEMNWKKKSCLYSSSRLLRGTGLRSEAVAAGVWAVPSLIAVTFLSSSFWLNCTAADGACDSYAIQCSLWSAPSEPSLSTHCLSTLEHTPPPSAAPPHSARQHPDSVDDHHVHSGRPVAYPERCWRTDLSKTVLKQY